MTAAESDSTRDSRRLAVLVARWLIPVVIVGWFVLSGHLGSAITALGQASPRWSALLLAAGIALPVSHAVRWRYLLRRIDQTVSLAGATQVTALASLVNYAAPGFLGAPAKAIFARDRYSVPVSQSLPTLAAEQALDALMLLFAAIVSVLATGTAIAVVDGGLEAVGDFHMALILVIALLVGTPAVWYAGRRLLPGFFASLWTATAALLRSPANRGQILALTGARWALDMLAVGIAAYAVGLRLGMLEILLLANVSLLAGLVAPVPGGLGVREAVMASIAGVLGISIPAILALSILHRAGLALGLPLVFAGARATERSSR